MKKLSVTFLIIMMGCSIIMMSCSSKSGDSNSEETTKPELLEYSVYFGTSGLIEGTDYNKNDVITPYVEEKFNIKVSEIIQSTSQMQPKEMLNMLIAAGNVPDVMVAGGDLASYAVSTGLYADLTEYIDGMENMNNYFPQDLWYLYENNGKRYQIPHFTPMATDPRYAMDPLFVPYIHSTWVREDILDKLGYKFTPLNEIDAKYMAQGKKAPIEAYEIIPAIDSPEKFIKLLQDIKALELKEGDREVIPFSTTWWSSFHFGAMYDYGQWRRDENGEVSGFLGTPEAKEFMKSLWTMYQENLIDPTYILQKDDQLQQKIASGLVGAGFHIPDLNGAINSLAKIDESYNIRFIPLPKRHENLGFFDIIQPGFYRWIIRKDFEEIERLVQYFDWFFSDEAIELMTWGPESAGLYTEKDGKRVFVDPQLADSLIGGTPDGKIGPENYGLWSPLKSNILNSYNNRAAITAPGIQHYNPMDSRHNYPLQVDKYIASRFVGMNGYDSQGIASYGDGGENTAAVSSYFWGTFQNDRIGKILSSKDEAEFEKNWQEQYDLFVKEGKYLEALADMEVWFDMYATKK